MNKSEFLHKLLEMKTEIMPTKDIFQDVIDVCQSYINKGCPEDNIEELSDLFSPIATAMTKINIMKESLERNEIPDVVKAIKKDVIQLTKLMVARDKGQEYDAKRLAELQDKLHGMGDFGVKMMKVDAKTGETEGWHDVLGNPVDGPSPEEMESSEEVIHIDDDVERDENGFCNDPSCEPCKTGKEMAKAMKNISHGIPMGKGGDA